MDELAITVDSDVRRLRISGAARMGENASVVISGYASRIAGVPVLRVSFNGKTMARFPLADGDAWGTSGDDATAVLNLSTEQFGDIAKKYPQSRSVQCLFTLEDADGTVRAAAYHPVMNAPGMSGSADASGGGGPGSVAWENVTGKPNFATVATSGSYNDLSDKPTIPTAVPVDTVLSGSSENPVQNKVVKAALDGKATAAQGAKADTALQSHQQLTAEYSRTPTYGGTWTVLREGVDVTSQVTQPSEDIPGFWTVYDTITAADVSANASRTSGVEGGSNASSLEWTVGLWNEERQDLDPVHYTATRARTDVIGYTLGSQTDKQLQPKGDYQPTLTAAQLANIAAVPNKADAGAIRYDLPATAITPTDGAPFVLAACFPIVYTPSGGSAVTVTAADVAELSVEDSEEQSSYLLKHNTTAICDILKVGNTYGGLADGISSVTFGDPATTPTYSTQVLGFTPTYALSDRAMNQVVVASPLPENGIALAFPAPTDGKVRDFLLRLETPAVGANGSVPQIAYPEGVTFENADGSFPEIAADDNAACATLLMFTETKAATTGAGATPACFLVKGEKLAAFASGGAS